MHRGLLRFYRLLVRYLTRLVHVPVLTVIILLLGAATASAQGSPPFDPQFQLPADPDTVVIAYSETPDMLANPDSTPLVRVYSDGKVLVHYPIYMKKAGDYQFFLTTGELRRLLIATSEIFDFDPQLAAEARRKERRTRAVNEGIETYRSDKTLEQIQVRLDGYQAHSGATQLAIDKHVQWRDIKADSKEFPGIPGMKGLGMARLTILDLLEHPRLQQVTDAEHGGAK